MAIRGAIDKTRENRGWHTEIPTDSFFREQTLLFPSDQKKQKKKTHFDDMRGLFLLWDNGEILLQRMECLHSHVTSVQRCQSRVF